MYIETCCPSKSQYNEVNQPGITADAADSQANPGRSAKAAHVNPAHVARHLGIHAMYANWPTTSVSEAPSRPRPITRVASQLSTTWSARLAART